MTKYASAEEVRAWYTSRGFRVGPTSLSKQHIAGWNKAHPDRPYLVNRCGTSSKYQSGCRCVPCVEASRLKNRNLYAAHATDGVA